MAYIEFKNVCKTYEDEEANIKALKKINFEIEKGQLVVIVGPSCSGKTTCLNVLGGLDKVTSGKIIIDKVDICELNERKLNKYRRLDVGFAFQSCNLIENLTVKENVELSTQISKNPEDTLAILKKVGLSKKTDYLPYELTKEEQQCASIARAIAKKPKILLCDEVIDNLDNKSKKQILKLLQNYAKKEKMIIVITTRSEDFSLIANQVITFKNGSIKDLKTNKKPISAGDLKW